MISVSIWRKTLEAQGACAEGLALFDAIAVQQPRTDPRRLRRIRIPRWTALHWIMLVQAGFGEWCATRGIVPRANLYGASLRGANLYDLLRAGYVPLAAQPDPGTLQHLRADLRDAVKERDEAESHAEMRARILTVRAEKAERERDEARRLHSDAEAQVACRNELRAQVAAAEGRFRAAEAERDTLRAELARLAAPGEGSEGGPWRAYGEPTDQKLVDAFEHAYSNAPSVRTHATAIRTIYRLGVAHELATIAMRARRVLAEAGPDPSKVVRAAMRRRYERDAHLDQARAGRGGTTRLWEAAENDEDAAVDAYRKAGGTP